MPASNPNASGAGTPSNQRPIEIVTERNTIENSVPTSHLRSAVAEALKAWRKCGRTREGASESAPPRYVSGLAAMNPAAISTSRSCSVAPANDIVHEPTREANAGSGEELDIANSISPISADVIELLSSRVRRLAHASGSVCTSCAICEPICAPPSQNTAASTPITISAAAASDQRLPIGAIRSMTPAKPRKPTAIRIEPNTSSKTCRSA